MTSLDHWIAGCRLVVGSAGVSCLIALSACVAPGDNRTGDAGTDVAATAATAATAVTAATAATSTAPSATDTAAGPTVAAAASTPSVPTSATPLPTSDADATRRLPPRPVPQANQTYTHRDDVRAFAIDVAAARAMDTDRVLAQLAQARYLPTVARLMMPAPAGTAKDWAAYRARFVEPRRIAAGVAFWRANRAWLEQAQARWGVPASLVVGVVGVETFYGRITGNFRVIDALSTLSFDFPAGRRDRTPFFRAQLEAFLHWCEQERIDPQTVLGSYAGAMGLPQFMPTSITSWAVDFDNDGRIDLVTSGADVVGSVAHYMAAHGWQRDVPTHYRVTPPAGPADRAVLLEPDILPTFTAAQMQVRGAVLHDDAARAHDGRLALVELQNGPSKPSTYVAGTQNFYVVTRYNWSSYYALAVIDLGQAVAAAIEAQASAGDSPKLASRAGKTVAR